MEVVVLMQVQIMAEMLLMEVMVEEQVGLE